MNNIFLLSCELGEEDRFTASLTYLFDCIPELDQSFIRILVGNKIDPIPKVQNILYQPAISTSDRPDLIYQCDSCDIIAEHKVDSGLGERQLERYLSHHYQKGKPVYVALITRDKCQISPEVLSADNYLRPDSKAEHFRWQDFYPVVSARSERIAQDFTQYMEALGMRLWEPGIWEDLFTNTQTIAEFNKHWKKVRQFFKPFAKKCQLDKRSGYGFQVRQPMPWIKLLYFFISRTAKPPEFRISPPYLGARVYVAANEPRIEKFGQDEHTITYEGGKIAVRTSLIPATWDKEIVNVLEYHTNLDNTLSTDAQHIQRRLLEFAQTIFEHVESIGNP